MASLSTAQVTTMGTLAVVSIIGFGFCGVSYGVYQQTSEIAVVSSKMDLLLEGSGSRRVGELEGQVEDLQKQLVAKTPPKYTGPPRYIDGNVLVGHALDEIEFYAEWLNYHLYLGFDHVFVYYEDSDPEPFRALLQPYVDAGYVTAIHRPKKGFSGECFGDFATKYAAKVKTFSILDTDEFLGLCKHATIGELVVDIGLANQDLDSGLWCAQLPWLLFGTSHLPDHPAGGSVLQSYYKRAPAFPEPYLGNGVGGKVLVSHSPLAACRH
jgi:hypothetical protein